MGQNVFVICGKRTLTYIENFDDYYYLAKIYLVDNIK